MNSITRLIIHDFKMKKFDWMGYEVANRSDFSFHHIIKKEIGGEDYYENGAILSYYSSHPYLHIIESKDLDMYIYINKILKEVNTQGCMPTTSQLILMQSVLTQFEREHCSDKRAKNKSLIRREYLIRRKY